MMGNRRDAEDEKVETWDRGADRKKGRGTRMAGHSVSFIVTIQALLQFSACCILLLRLGL